MDSKFAPVCSLKMMFLPVNCKPEILKLDPAKVVEFELPWNEPISSRNPSHPSILPPASRMVIKDTEMELLVKDTDTGIGFLIWITTMIGPFAVILPVFSWDVRARFRWKKGFDGLGWVSV